MLTSLIEIKFGISSYKYSFIYAMRYECSNFCVSGDMGHEANPFMNIKLG